MTAQYVLCAVGRIPIRMDFLPKARCRRWSGGRVQVDEHFQTSIEGVYAIGDLIFGMQLAHTASAQERWWRRNWRGKRPSVDFECGSFLCLHLPGDRLCGADGG